MNLVGSSPISRGRLHPNRRKQNVLHDQKSAGSGDGRSCARYCRRTKSGVVESRMAFEGSGIRDAGLKWSEESRSMD